MRAQELDGELDELAPVLLAAQHGGHLLRAEVPAAHAQQRLDHRVLLLYVIEALKPEQTHTFIV